MADQSKRFEELQELLQSTKDDFVGFYEQNNQAAGTRIRKKMQDLKKLAQDIRVEIQEMKNNEK
jgi:hypothetical protein